MVQRHPWRCGAIKAFISVGESKRYAPERHTPWYSQRKHLAAGGEGDKKASWLYLRAQRDQATRHARHAPVWRRRQIEPSDDWLAGRGCTLQACGIQQR